MKQFKTVFLFEYMGYVKDKRFQITTAVLLAAILIASFIPQIVIITSSFGNNKKDAGFFAGDGINITALALNESVSLYNWEQIKTVPDGGFETLIADKKYNAVFYYNGGDTYDFYTTGRSIDDFAAKGALDDIVGLIYSEELIKDMGPDAIAAAEIINNIEIKANHIAAGGDFMQNYWLAYILVFALYFATALSNQFIATSVVMEKSSKTMELLITSAKPDALMFGKVLGVGAASLTQLLAITLAAVIMLLINTGPWLALEPAVLNALNQVTGSPALLLSFFVFFLLGFFTYGFFYASLCSTVNRIEDVNSISVIPTMFLAAGFCTALFGGMFNIDSTAVKVMSFIPLFAPMVMFTRQCMNAAAWYEVVISIVLTAGGVFATGLCAAKIYRVGVMMYGKTPSINEIVKMLSKG